MLDQELASLTSLDEESSMSKKDAQRILDRAKEGQPIPLTTLNCALKISELLGVY